jgi:folate-binding protein YgfZ
MTVPFQARITRDLVVVEGADATSFLQSLVSQDLDALAVGEAGHTLLLAPQGKLLVDFYVLHVSPDVWWCVCEEGFGAALASGLNRFKIRVKVEIAEVAVGALALRGVEPPAVVPDDVQVFGVQWSGAPAYDAVGPEASVAALSSAVDAPLIDADGYELARIEAGISRQGFDTDERTIPQEAGLELVAVSFTKGCFVGQELVCRIDSRGHVNRHLRRLRASDASLARGDVVTFDGREVGEVTSAAGGVALAMVRREVEGGAEVGVGAGAGATTAVVETL